MASNCLLNCAIGVQEFLKSPEKEPLEVRLEKDETKKMIGEKMEKNYKVKFEQVDDSLQNTSIEGNDNEHPIIDIYVAGQDFATSSIKEIGETLMKRDYPKVAASLGWNDKEIGVIAVPETFIPKKARAVKPEIADEVIRNNPEDTKLAAELKLTKADLIEKQVRDVVTGYYKELDGVAVLIICGLEMLMLDAPKGKNIQEVDFLIINYSKQYILNIEVKRSLTEAMTGKRSNRVTIIEKAKQQSQKIKQILEDWYPHLKGPWKYCSMFYCEEEMSDKLRECGHCLDFIAQGSEDLLAKVKVMDEKMPNVPSYLEAETQTIQISLKNDVLAHHGTFEGTYELSTPVNGNPSWISSTNAIWSNPEYPDWWMIGKLDDIGQIGNIIATGMFFGQTKTYEWRYSIGSELKTPAEDDILVECIARKDDESSEIVCKHIDDLKDMMQHSLFSGPPIPLPVRGNMVSFVSKALQEAGSLANIRLWAYPNPRQRAIFSSPKLILLGPWGCGKTLFLTSEAIDTANRGEKAMLLIFARGDYSTKKPMLALDMEEKLKDYPNITVKTVFFIDGEDNNLMDLTQDCKHIFVDEMFADIEALEPESQEELRELFSSKETVWVAMSNTYYGSRLDGSVDLEAWAKSKLPDDFQVVRMDTPLRMPATVAKRIKDGYSGMSKATNLKLNPRLMAECQVPSNLVEGCAIEEFSSDELESLYQLLQPALEQVPEDNYAVMIIDDRPLEETNAFMRSLIKCKCRDIILVLTVKLAMLKAGKELTEFHCIGHSSPEERLKKLITVNRSRHLVLSTALKNGYEHNVIFDLTRTLDVDSRSSAKLVTLYPNTLLDMMVVYERLLKNEGHNCDEMMALTVEDLANISFSLSDWLDEKLSGYTRSKSLPFPKKYDTWKNPLLEIFADQLKQDPEWSEKGYAGSDLLNDILKALDDKKLDWPEDFTLLPGKEWIERIRIDPIFYLHHATDASEMQIYEKLLLQLAANFLKRTIKLVPILDEDPELIIETTLPSNPIGQLHIAYCNSLKSDNFFVSVFPQKNLIAKEEPKITKLHRQHLGPKCCNLL